MSNKLVVCPYDEAHKVKESRIQLHITKCRMNHISEKKFTCPFNATHVFPVQEHDYHFTRCPDRAIMDRMKAGSLNQNNPFKGRTAVPSYSEPIPIDADEVWDTEESYDITPGYCPVKEAPSCAIVQPTPLSKPADRRQLYRDLHQKPSDLDKKSGGANVPAPVPAVPRQPKQPSEAERKFVEEHAASVQYLGLGRGRPTNATAANIFSQKPNGQSNYSAVTSGMKNLGLGSGAVNRAPANQPFLNDDDFPALGLGRGVAKNPPRQEMKAPGSRW